MADILIIEDNDLCSQMLHDVCRRLGHHARPAFNLEDGLKSVAKGAFDVILLDLYLPDGHGLTILSELKSAPSNPEIIILTGADEPGSAELAFKAGVWDYLEKPSSPGQVELALSRALQYRQEKGPAHAPILLRHPEIIGNSSSLVSCLSLAAKASCSEAGVLITGETGTGKELFARTIHANSLRAGNPFVVVDCASLPETLVESILFGHERGAFTGADRPSTGLLKQADGGTLFLDEIGELKPAIQKSFLRVLQEHRYRPVGARDEITSDFRLISATNRDLSQLDQEGGFRNDLLFRINALVVELPPLRERVEDIKELAIHHVFKVCSQYFTEIKGVSPEFLRDLTRYPWPGNVRELFNVLDRALALVGLEPTLYPKHLPPAIRSYAHSQERRKIVEISPQVQLPPSLPTLNDLRESVMTEVERKYLENLISITGNDLEEAGRISGLSKPRIYALLKKYKIQKPKSR